MLQRDRKAHEVILVATVNHSYIVLIKSKLSCCLFLQFHLHKWKSLQKKIKNLKKNNKKEKRNYNLIIEMHTFVSDINGRLMQANTLYYEINKMKQILSNINLQTIKSSTFNLTGKEIIEKNQRRALLIWEKLLFSFFEQVCLLLSS